MNDISSTSLLGLSLAVFLKLSNPLRLRKVGRYRRSAAAMVSLPTARIFPVIDPAQETATKSVTMMPPGRPRRDFAAAYFGSVIERLKRRLC